MKQFLMIAGLFGFLVSTGCTKVQTRGGCMTSNQTCDTGCSSQQCGGCNNCNAYGGHGGCQDQCGGGARGCCQVSGRGCPQGCRPRPLSWQQGGTDYAHALTVGMLKKGQVNQQPGPPSASVGYPYYTVRGPRDFLVDNPPTIGR